MKLPKFLVGMLIGTAVALIIWYWQKSTSAEEGALAVLDRLVAAEARVRELEGQLRLSEAQPYLSEQQEVLSGLPDLWGLEKSSQSAASEQDNALAAGFSGALDSERIVDDLRQINGIGPVYERRLQETGILTYSDLARQAPEHLKEIPGLKLVQLAELERWVSDAESFLEE